MKKNINFLLGTLFVLLLLAILPNCARYNPKELIRPKNSNSKINKDGLVASKKVLTENECKKYFNRKLLARGFQPVQLFIKNKTNKTYTLKAEDINAELIPVKRVSRKMHRNVGWKATKYFIIGGPIWAALEGYSSHEVNGKINSDLEERAIEENSKFKIKPNRILNKVFFVRKSKSIEDFNIKLIDSETKEKITLNL